MSKKFASADGSPVVPWAIEVVNGDVNVTVYARRLFSPDIASTSRAMTMRAAVELADAIYEAAGLQKSHAVAWQKGETVHVSHKQPVVEK